MIFLTGMLMSQQAAMLFLLITAQLGASIFIVGISYKMLSDYLAEPGKVYKRLFLQTGIAVAAGLLVYSTVLVRFVDPAYVTAADQYAQTLTAVNTAIGSMTVPLLLVMIWNIVQRQKGMYA
ncbi:hypothetical protein [Alteribacter natronophilus]|uniref:hypothetical protein n=1 Tax=Alteribacter natronophilus TaxID=2583810 RepID=UPI00110DC92B|nr:hypothetical protein [Alteribacter natronophilus]TMW72967.1 hypothetical protein FGB90_01255 [Alteribacter natronophilus]